MGNTRKCTLVIEKLIRAQKIRSLIGQLEKGKVYQSIKTKNKFGIGSSVCSLIIEQEEVEEVIGAISPELRNLLYEPRVQTIIASIRSMEEEKVKLVLNFIDMLNNPKIK